MNQVDNILILKSKMVKHLRRKGRTVSVFVDLTTFTFSTFASKHKYPVSNSF